MRKEIFLIGMMVLMLIPNTTIANESVIVFSSVPLSYDGTKEYSLFLKFEDQGKNYEPYIFEIIYKEGLEVSAKGYYKYITMKQDGNKATFTIDYKYLPEEGTYTYIFFKGLEIKGKLDIFIARKFAPRRKLHSEIYKIRYYPSSDLPPFLISSETFTFKAENVKSSKYLFYRIRRYDPIKKKYANFDDYKEFPINVTNILPGESVYLLAYLIINGDEEYLDTWAVKRRSLPIKYHIENVVQVDAETYSFDYINENYEYLENVNKYPIFTVKGDKLHITTNFQGRHLLLSIDKVKINSSNPFSYPTEEYYGDFIEEYTLPPEGYAYKIHIYTEGYPKYESRFYVKRKMSVSVIPFIICFNVVVIGITVLSVLKDKYKRRRKKLNKPT